MAPLMTLIYLRDLIILKQLGEMVYYLSMTLVLPNNSSMRFLFTNGSRTEIPSVVFVHDLFGYPERRWTYSPNMGNRVYWPYHLLPQDLQTARIFAYGWGAPNRLMRPQRSVSIPATVDNLAIALSSLAFKQDPEEGGSRSDSTVYDPFQGLFALL